MTPSLGTSLLGLALLGISGCQLITDDDHAERIDGLGCSDDDDDAPTWYADSDSDGFGDAAVTVRACELPTGFVERTEDCDDTDPTVFAGAVEVCSGADTDCNGVVDDVADAPVWFEDGDGDGFGDGTAPLQDCTQPAGTVAIGGDCDDGDVDVHPDAPVDDCDGVDADCDGQLDEDPSTRWFADVDGDGFGDAASVTLSCAQPLDHVADADDCNDADAAIHPAADEVCDPADTDENCNAVADDEDSGVVDALTWYADSDGDAFGDAGSASVACDQPAGSSDDDTDCDDARDDVYPGADEVCDLVDNDCDGGVDENGLSTWFADADGDGYGDPAISVAACLAPPEHVDNSDDCDDGDAGEPQPWWADTDGDGFGDPGDRVLGCGNPAPGGRVANDGDCDDSEAEFNPDAAEACDGLNTDEDCDGEADNNDPDGALRELRFWHDSDGDGAGDPKTATYACDGGGGLVATGDDCDDTDPTIKPGAGCVGFVGGTTSMLDAQSKIFGESADDRSGRAVAFLGDVNGDGLSDIVVGAFQNSANGAKAGSAYVLHSPFTGNVDLATDAAATLRGVAAGDRAGVAVAGGGDFDGDGKPDLLVGAFRESTVGFNAGAVYFISGDVSGTRGLDGSDSVWLAESADQLAGRAVAFLGDIDGDGADEALVGAYGGGGRVYVVAGGTGSDSLSAAVATVTSEGVDDDAGQAVSAAGDTNGDGLLEFIVGAPGRVNGAAYLVDGDVLGTVPLSDARAILTGTAAGDEAGHAVAAAGDTDRDGYADIIVSAYFNDAGGQDAGAVYVMTGPINGSLALSGADAVITGEQANDLAGESVAGAGDVNLDGHDDVALCVRGDDEGGNGSGAMFVFLSPVSGSLIPSQADAKVTGDSAFDRMGLSMDGGGDADGDGIPDFLTGSWLDDEAAKDAGASHLVLGGRL